MAHSVEAEHSLTFRTNDVRRFSVGAVQYVALEPIASLTLPFKEECQPLTVVPVEPKSPWTGGKLSKYLNDVGARDDVSCELFRRFLLFSGTTFGVIKLRDDALKYMEHLQVRHKVVEIGGPTPNKQRHGIGFVSRPIAEGPYLWMKQQLYPVYRLYEDKSVSLINCLQPHNLENSYSTLDILSCNPTIRFAAIPSRRLLSHKAGRFGGIRGSRIVLKDMFDIKGLRKTACCKAYYDISTPAKTTAPMIQLLIDHGAVIVGTSRLSSLVSREEPSESFDYDAPFNPRGDGYQSPAGSSSGSAAAIAAYDWLDFGIGTDSTGSARRPAMVNGVFSIRMSSGCLPVEGMVPCFPLFDAPAVFTRNIRNLDTFVEDWCDGILSPKVKKPTSIIMPKEYFPVKDYTQQHILDQFVDDLSHCFEINIRNVCLHDMWEDSPPFEASGQALEVYLQDVGQNSFFYDFYHASDAFRTEYERRYQKAPAVNRITKWRWNVAKGISKAQRYEAVHRLGVYKHWLLDQVLAGDNPVVALPVMDAVPNYRDTPPSEACPASQEAWDQLWMAPILGSPEITVPIGQIPYHSRVSEREEQLPIAISLMGLPGTDISLINTARTVLEKSGRPTRVATGGEMFAEGDWEMIERTPSF